MFNKVGAEGLFNQKCPEEMEKGGITSEKDSLLSQFGLITPLQN